MTVESEVIVFLSVFAPSNVRYNLKDVVAKEKILAGITSVFVSNQIKFALQLHANTAAVALKTLRKICVKIIK